MLIIKFIKYYVWPYNNIMCKTFQWYIILYTFNTHTSNNFIHNRNAIYGLIIIIKLYSRLK